MACTYDLIQSTSDPCYLDVIEQPSGKTVRQIWFSEMKWENKGDDDITIRDSYDSFTADIDIINGFATVAAVITFLEPLRLACDIAINAGGGGLTPTLGNGVYDYKVVTNTAVIAAGFQSVSILNIGTANAFIDSGAGPFKIVPGQAENIDAYLDPVTAIFKLTPAITYDATPVGAELKISTYL